jgi:hypothetical protein
MKMALTQRLVVKDVKYSLPLPRVGSGRCANQRCCRQRFTPRGRCGSRSLLSPIESEAPSNFVNRPAPNPSCDVLQWGSESAERVWRRVEVPGPDGLVQP